MTRSSLILATVALLNAGCGSHQGGEISHDEDSKPIKSLRGQFAKSTSMHLTGSIAKSFFGDEKPPLSPPSEGGDEGAGGSDPIGPSIDTYQIGSVWGKKLVSEKSFRHKPHLLRAAKATARLKGATSFLLGKFNGELVLATNYHVCDSLTACVGQVADFPLLKKSARVTKTLGTWPTIDLALVTIRVSSSDMRLFTAVARNFNFEFPMRPGQPLFTAGYGVAGNPTFQLMSNEDDDCRIFSKKDDFHLMSDPDEVNSGSYEAWSFANGCDVSHGDSGSAMVDRNSGAPIGILWTGKVPKSSFAQDSRLIRRLIGGNDPRVWSEFTYAVPAAKIKEYLSTLLDEHELPAHAHSIVAAVVGYTP
jgi:hypothetical protein